MQAAVHIQPPSGHLLAFNSLFEMRAHMQNVKRARLPQRSFQFSI